MGQHWSHLTPTKRIQLDAFIRAGMKPTDIAKELGVHHTTIYRELKRCTYEHLNSDYTTETRYNPEGAQARYEANLRAKGPELKIGNDYELADYLIAKIRDEKYSPEAAIGEAEVKGWPFKTHICASTAYNYIRGEIFGDELTVSMLPQHGKRHQPERPAGSMPRKPAGRSIEDRPEHINDRSTFGHWEMDITPTGSSQISRHRAVSVPLPSAPPESPASCAGRCWSSHGRRVPAVPAVHSHCRRRRSTAPHRTGRQ